MLLKYCFMGKLKCGLTHKGPSEEKSRIYDNFHVFN